MSAHRARPVLEGGPHPVGRDGTGEPASWQLRAVPHPGAAARPVQCGTPLRRSQPGQQVNDGVPALGVDANV